MTVIAGIKACVFDAYGTMFDVHSPVSRVAGELGEKAQAVSQTWRDKQLQYTWLRSLMGAHADFWQVTGDALDFALEVHGVDDRAIRERLMDAYLTLDAYDDTAPCLKALKAAGLATAILSNGSPTMLDAAVTSAGIGGDLDAVLSIEEVGIYKPDARVYQLAVDRLGVAASEICFVSNNPWDASAGAHFGYQVARLNRYGMPADKLPGDFAAVMRGLDELPRLVA